MLYTNVMLKQKYANQRIFYLEIFKTGAKIP